MPRSEARLQFSIWDGLDSLSDAGKLAYLVILTEEHVTQCGSGPLRKSMWGKRLRWEPSKLDDALAEVDRERYVLVDEDTEELLVRSFLRGDKVDRQPRVLQAALKSAVLIQSKRLRAALAEELRKLDDGTATGLLADVVQEALAVADVLEGRKSRRPAPVAVEPELDPESTPDTSGRPSDLCPAHLSGKAKRPCRACASARRAAEEWDVARRRAADDGNAADARARAAERRAAIDACGRCDSEGYDGRVLCKHKPRPVIQRRAP